MINHFSEPVWGEPQDAIEACSALAAMGPSPAVLTGVFLRLLQYHFSTQANIENPLLKEYIWTSSTAGCVNTEQDGVVVPGSRILIRPSYSPRGPEVQQLPSLLVKREPVQSTRISFQDKSLVGLNQNHVFDGTQYQVNIAGAHSIICRGGTGVEADLLAEEVFFRMLHYQQIIKQDFRLGFLLAESMADVKSRDEYQRVFYAVVRMTWAYVYRWKLIPESPIIKRVVLGYRER